MEDGNNHDPRLDHIRENIRLRQEEIEAKTPPLEDVVSETAIGLLDEFGRQLERPIAPAEQMRQIRLAAQAIMQTYPDISPPHIRGLHLGVKVAMSASGIPVPKPKLRGGQ
jgi:hypothetical protein